MSETRKWDMASTHSLESGAEWLLGKADALAVVVIRVNDAVLAADPGISPADVDRLVCERMQQLVRNLNLARHDKRKAASLEMEPVRE